MGQGIQLEMNILQLILYIQITHHHVIPVKVKKKVKEKKLKKLIEI